MDRDAAIRETREETGLDVAEGLVELDHRYTYEVREEWRQAIYGPGVTEVTEEVFAAEVDAEVEIRLSDEHDEYRWCTLDEAERLLKWPENVGALYVLLRRLGRT